MIKKEKLIIIGCGNTGEMLYEYFTHDSIYDVVAFSAERKYLKGDTLKGKPVIPLEDLPLHYHPDEYKTFVALAPTKLNRLRTRVYQMVKDMGYTCANYICSSAKLWPSSEIGENCCIMDFCVVEPNTKIGNNVTLFHGTFIGHDSVIKNNCWIVCCVISGLVEMGNNCFIGANSAIADSIKLEDDCFVSLGSAINKNCEKGSIYTGNPAKRRKINVYKFFKIIDDSES